MKQTKIERKIAFQPMPGGANNLINPNRKEKIKKEIENGNAKRHLYRSKGRRAVKQQI